MKKGLLIALAGLGIMMGIMAFKNTGSEKKEYLTIYYNETWKAITISHSNGKWEELDYEKMHCIGQYAQILKLINAQETQGFKLVNFNYETSPKSSRSGIITVLMEK